MLLMVVVLLLRVPLPLSHTLLSLSLSACPSAYELARVEVPAGLREEHFEICHRHPVAL